MISTIEPQSLLLLERLLLMLQYLEDDPVYADEYERFVTGLSYAAKDERSSFSQALDIARRIVSQIESTKPETDFPA